MKKPTDKCHSCKHERSEHFGYQEGSGYGSCRYDTTDPDITCMGPVSECGCPRFVE
jgi:hypothetical protein